MKDKMLNVIIIFLLILVAGVGLYIFVFNSEKKVEKITLNKVNLNLLVGDKETLIPNVTPKDVDYELVWESDNASVAIVSNDGSVTGQGEGEAVIKVYDKESNVTARCNVKVTKKTIEDIVLDKTNIEIKVGETSQITATITPSDLSNEKLTWITSDSNIAIVNENGLVTGIGEGEVTITVYGGNIDKTCIVKVISDSPVYTPIITPYITPYVTPYMTPYVTPYATPYVTPAVTSQPTNTPKVTATPTSGDCKITLNANGGSVSKDSITASVGSKIGSIPTPTRGGYSFVEWNTSKDGKGTKITSSHVCSTSSPTKIYAIWKKDSSSTGGNLEIHFINAGGYYDDAILIKSSQATIFMDGGRGKDAVVKYLNKLNIKTIDYVIGSHTEYDHINAQGEVIKQFDVKNALYPNDIFKCGCACDATDVGEVNKALRSKNMTPKVQSVPSKLQIGDMTLYFISPFKVQCNKNNNSFIFILQYKNNKFMFTGDQDSDLNNVNQLIDNAKSLGLSGIEADMLKYPHHGNQALSDTFLDKLKAKYVVVPNVNACQTPSQVSMNKLNNHNIKVYRQCESSTGNILLTSDGSTIKIKMDV